MRIFGEFILLLLYKKPSNWYTVRQPQYCQLFHKDNECCVLLILAHPYSARFGTIKQLKLVFGVCKSWGFYLRMPVINCCLLKNCIRRSTVLKQNKRGVLCSARCWSILEVLLNLTDHCDLGCRRSQLNYFSPLSKLSPCSSILQKKRQV